jgi:hypothetical protein
MSILNRLAHSLGRRDDVPNQELARELAEAKGREGIRELVANLRNKDRGIQSDCIKVLYEVGYLAPELIAGYVNEFLDLLQSRNNRLVWGGMIALSTIAEIKSAELFDHRDDIQQAIEKGSVITVDNGIKALAIVASKQAEYRDELFPYLLKHLATCRPKDVPQHAEEILVAVDAGNKEAFIGVVESRMVDMTPAQMRRLRKVIGKAENR